MDTHLGHSQSFDRVDYSQNIDNTSTKPSQKQGHSILSGREVKEETKKDPDIKKIDNTSNIVFNEGQSSINNTSTTPHIDSGEFTSINPDTSTSVAKTDTIYNQVTNSTKTISTIQNPLDQKISSNSSSKAQSITNEQNTLKDKLEQILSNFDVIKTNDENKDIRNCKVIIIGEIHDEEAILRSQEELISSLWEKGTSTLFTEIGAKGTRLFSNHQEDNSELVENITTTIHCWDDPSIQQAIIKDFVPQLDDIFIKGELIYRIIDKCVNEKLNTCNFTPVDLLGKSTYELLKNEFKSVDIDKELNEICTIVTKNIEAKRAIVTENISLLKQKLDNNEISPAVFIKLQPDLEKMLKGEVQLKAEGLQKKIDKISSKLQENSNEAKEDFEQYLDFFYDQLTENLQEPLLTQFKEKFPNGRVFQDSFTFTEDELAHLKQYRYNPSRYEAVSTFIEKALQKNDLESALSSITEEITNIRLSYQMSSEEIQEAKVALNDFKNFFDSSKCSEYIEQSIVHASLIQLFGDWAQEQEKVNTSLHGKAMESIAARNDHMAKKILEQIEQSDRIFVTAGGQHIVGKQLQNLYNELEKQGVTYYTLNAKIDKVQKNIDFDNIEVARKRYNEILSNLHNGVALHALQYLNQAVCTFSRDCLVNSMIDWKRYVEQK